ncbi:DNA repair protein XRCC3 isoform X3 [Paramormyrops kingsleyae]|uniref:DNA repair protein XRCC3 isoform X3 n=1 Tax=Paramormyrops kingsleyae TaxID=1676925 RepID=UPI000CD6565F|nr:DNA repair protein XRCC3 isoform X3 [Paramormyrops kingsleyae]
MQCSTAAVSRRVSGSGASSPADFGMPDSRPSDARRNPAERHHGAGRGKRRWEDADRPAAMPNCAVPSGAVYICTEDTFPIKRLRQLITQQPRLRPELPTDLLHGLCFSDNIYIEHAADLGVLQTCLSQRVPILLARGLARLVVLDSVAALFRCEFTAEESSERARHLVALASTLQRLSHSFNAPVLCINQVTDVVEHCDASQFRCGLVESPVLPALGMAWANQLLVRLMMRRLGGVPSLEAAIGVPRRLEVVYAPHLPRASCLCHIGEEGVRGDLSPDSAHIVSSHMDL